MEPKELSCELWREYFVTLYVGKTSHRIVDGDGVVHCIAFPGPDGATVIRWKSKDPLKPVAF